jgi:hypothetical protein
LPDFSDLLKKKKERFDQSQIEPDSAGELGVLLLNENETPAASCCGLKLAESSILRPRDHDIRIKLYTSGAGASFMHYYFVSYLWLWQNPISVLQL